MDPDRAHFESPQEDSIPQAAGAPQDGPTPTNGQYSVCEPYKQACGHSATRRLGRSVVIGRIRAGHRGEY